MKRMLIALALLVLAATATPSLAQVYNLRAAATTVTMPDGAVVAMWGFAQDAGPVTVPGPLLEVPANDSVLTINLTNNLPVPVSVIIPGQSATLAPVRFTDAQGRQRVRSFAAETAPGATRAYTWTGLKPGTFLYQSGTHPAVQVQMGLYGAVKKDQAAGLAYPGVAYDSELVLLFSEIDPALHQAVATDDYGPGKGVTSTLDYRPKYFLINGEPYSAAQTPLPGVNLGEQVLLRLLNAGLESHVPTLQGLHLRVVAEDGNPYLYPRELCAPLLAAGKTLDALVEPWAAGAYPLYDRRLYLTSAAASPGGMLQYLEVASPGGAPVAVADAYGFTEDGGTLNVAAPGVLANDVNATSAVLVSGVSGGVLTLRPDGSFDYTPNLNFNGTDLFTYQAQNGGLVYSEATVQITVAPVNDAPLAVNDAAATQANAAVTVNVLANDSDLDGDMLMVHGATNGAHGTVVVNAGATVTYTPATDYVGPDSFTYTVSDMAGGSATATVSVTVNPRVNQRPVAVDDSATTRMNTVVTIRVLDNDYDPDGTLDPATVRIVTQPRRGTVVVNGNGTGRVYYTPRLNFRGTDVFTYYVRDNEGMRSNTATVRVNVIR